MSQTIYDSFVNYKASTQYLLSASEQWPQVISYWSHYWFKSWLPYWISLSKKQTWHSGLQYAAISWLLTNTTAQSKWVVTDVLDVTFNELKAVTGWIYYLLESIAIQSCNWILCWFYQNMKWHSIASLLWIRSHQIFGLMLAIIECGQWHSANSLI